MRMMNEVMISPCVVMGSTRLYSRAAIEPSVLRLTTGNHWHFTANAYKRRMLK